MERKEPPATPEEYKKRVVRYQDIPPIESVPGAISYILPAERLTVSFVTLQPNLRITPHRHESEQVVIVLDGACDFLVDGKQYHLEKDNVLTIPSKVEHGNYSSDRGLRMIEVFSPPRYDLVAEMQAVKRA